MISSSLLCRWTNHLDPSLKHGEVIPGNDENEHVHLPSREGDPRVVTVTANTKVGFKIKTNI